MSSVLLMAGVIALAAASPVSVAVTGACPSEEAVTAALRSALGADATSAGTSVPKVSDLGDRFSVAASGQVREYADPGRDCDERARAAAVFIALALNPPLVATAAPPPAPQVIAPPPPPAQQEATGWLDLGVAARLDGGPALALGAEVRASAGWRWFGLAATAGVLAPAESTFSSVVVRQQRFPLSLALTARRGITPRLALAGAVGVALVPLTLRAEALDGPSETRLDAGVRLAGALAFVVSPRLRPFVALHAEIFPRAYQLEVDPLGNVGSTGRFWAGVSVGLSFAALR